MMQHSDMVPLLVPLALLALAIRKNTGVLAALILLVLFLMRL
jgi:hypothetical protein